MTPNLDTLAAVVARGLEASPKRLPAWLFYDEAGSALYEQITELAEYYPTRTEERIFAGHAHEMAELVPNDRPLTVMELGAGSALKTIHLLRALSARTVTFMPVDVSPSALELAAARVHHELPGLRVDALTATHEHALMRAECLADRRLILFIGSSIGNYEDDEAVALLRRIRHALGSQGHFVLGTDMKKDVGLLIPAYDDAKGVTARFNLNTLARINRELGGRFELDRFSHVALWNEAASRVEMHLESRGRQAVYIEALGRTFVFEAGERIHTESSVKYDLEHVDRLLAASGLERLHTFTDDERWFAVHLIVAGRRPEA